MGSEGKRRWPKWAFVLGFAALMTGAWTQFGLTLPTLLDTVVWHFYLIVNFGGACLTYLIQGYLGPEWMDAGPELGSVIYGESASSVGHDFPFKWIVVLGTVFVGALVQGLVYSAIGSAIVRWWRRQSAPEPTDA